MGGWVYGSMGYERIGISPYIMSQGNLLINKTLKPPGIPCICTFWENS